MNDQLSPEELLPCPFCGCTDIFVEPDECGSGGQSVPPVHVGCTSCWMVVQTDETEEAARALWNKRHKLQ